MSAEYHQTALTFLISHKLEYAQVWRDTHQYVDITFTALCRFPQQGQCTVPANSVPY